MLAPILLSFLLEIITVTSTWNPGSCNEACGNLLEKQLQKYPPIDKMEMTKGKVVMYWKPNAPFNYMTLKRNYQWVGVSLRLEPFTLKVRGTISTNGGDMVLTSIGDNTRFNLVGPAPKSSSQYVTRGALVNHKLQGDLLDQLKAAQKDRTVVEITGDLYLPENPPMRILIDKLTIPQKDDNKK